MRRPVLEAFEGVLVALGALGLEEGPINRAIAELAESLDHDRKRVASAPLEYLTWSEVFEIEEDGHKFRAPSPADAAAQWAKKMDELGELGIASHGARLVVCVQQGAQRWRFTVSGEMAPSYAAAAVAAKVVA